MQQAPPPKPALAPRLAAVVVAALLWFAACPLHGLYLTNVKTGARDFFLGVSCAFFGPYGIVYGCPAWYGNLTVLVAAGLLLARRYVGAVILSGISFTLALTVVILYWVDIPLDEGDVGHARLAFPGPGCALWALSLAVPGIAALWRRAREQR
jgi:hypothetical protein